jgi:hypothetical protein
VASAVASARAVASEFAASGRKRSRCGTSPARVISALTKPNWRWSTAQLGIAVAPRGRLLLALTFTIDDDKIAEYDVIADPARLQQLDLAVLN